MAPLAKLTVERQRLYRKECSEDQYEDGDGFVFSQFNQGESCLIYSLRAGVGRL